MGRAITGLAILLALCLALNACNEKPEMAEERLWLARETENFLNIYKVAYTTVASLQGTPHPCTNGHKAAEAALFHAVLENLNQAYEGYKKKIDKRLGDAAKTDAPMRDMISVVDRLAQPFSSVEQVARCGKLDKSKAKEQFYLQAPVEAQQAVATLQTRINEMNE